MLKNVRSRLRKNAGLTQIELSRLTDIPQSRISSWENGNTELAPHDVVKIAEALRKHLDQVPYFNAVGDLVRALTTMREPR